MFFGSKHPTDLQVVVTGEGETPTPDDGACGRASMVWYNQASMFQRSEIGLHQNGYPRAVRPVLDYEQNINIGYSDSL